SGLAKTSNCGLAYLGEEKYLEEELSLEFTFGLRHFTIIGLDLLSQRHTKKTEDADILHTALNLNPIPDHTAAAGHSNISLHPVII
ncbi:hypothetical protein, partial [Klebsiella pneumoniae]|uniref:hypothetical protein n=1 Tax=Klebsiella pneumoniae TaxID=573 RepID=UPI002730B547